MKTVVISMVLLLAGCSFQRQHGAAEDGHARTPRQYMQSKPSTIDQLRIGDSAYISGAAVLATPEGAFYIRKEALIIHEVGTRWMFPPEYYPRVTRSSSDGLILDLLHCDPSRVQVDVVTSDRISDHYVKALVVK